MLHPAYPVPSSWHSKVEPASVDINAKVADVELARLEGLIVMPVSGEVVSITHMYAAGVGSEFPEASTALASKV